MPHGAVGSEHATWAVGSEHATWGMSLVGTRLEGLLTLLLLLLRGLAPLRPPSD